MKIGDWRRQRLAWQAQINGAARRGHGDRERAVDDLLDLVAVAELVVPLDVFAQHGALVAHLLAPVDRQIARAEPAGFGDRGAAGGEQDRHVLARGIEQAHERVRHADVDVDHDRLRPARGEVVAVRHADRDRLVRGGERLGHREAGGGAARERLDHRREIGAGIGEQPVDAARLEQHEIGLGDRLDAVLSISHVPCAPSSDW